MSTVADLYGEDLEEFEEWLDITEGQASKEKDINFVVEMAERYEEYGERMFLSVKQQEWLERIAND